MSGFSQTSSLGFNLGYAGRDGTNPDFTYDIFYQRKIYNKFEAKLSYLKSDVKQRLSEVVSINNNINVYNEISGSLNQSKDPYVEVSNLDVISFGFLYPINRFKNAEIRVYTGICYFKESGNYTTSWRSNPEPAENYITVLPNSDNGLGFELSLGFRQNFLNSFFFQIDTYLIVPISQAGIKSGIGFRF